MQAAFMIATQCYPCSLNFIGVSAAIASPAVMQVALETCIKSWGCSLMSGGMLVLENAASLEAVI